MSTAQTNIIFMIFLRYSASKYCPGTVFKAILKIDEKNLDEKKFFGRDDWLLFSSSDLGGWKLVSKVRRRYPPRSHQRLGLSVAFSVVSSKRLQRTIKSNKNTNFAIKKKLTDIDNMFRKSVPSSGLICYCDRR